MTDMAIVYSLVVLGLFPVSYSKLHGETEKLLKAGTKTRNICEESRRSEFGLVTTSGRREPNSKLHKRQLKVLFCKVRITAATGRFHLRTLELGASRQVPLVQLRFQSRQKANRREVKRNLHSFIRVELPVHGQREAEQTPRFSAFPEDLTGIKVKGEHRRRLQTVETKRKCKRKRARASQQRRHGSAVQMCPAARREAAHHRSARRGLTGGCGGFASSAAPPAGAVARGVVLTGRLASRRIIQPGKCELLICGVVCK